MRAEGKGMLETAKFGAEGESSHSSPNEIHR